MNTNKIRFKYMDMWFVVPNTVVRQANPTTRYKLPYLNISRQVGAMMIKQYIKKNYPSYKSYVSSESFSGGNSITGNVTNLDGSKIDSNDYLDIRRFANTLKMGSFNGMTDSYDYENRNLTTSLGHPIKSSCKYISINDYPKYGTIEWAINRYEAKSELERDIIIHLNDSVTTKFNKYLSSQK